MCGQHRTPRGMHTLSSSLSQPDLVCSELYPVCIAPMNIEQHLRQAAIQLLCMVPNVREWIDVHLQQYDSCFSRCDVEAAYADTKAAVWKAIFEDIHTATQPEGGVWFRSFYGCAMMTGTVNWSYR